ncbi:MAG: hypothetical protein H7145_24940, partial [Akkermansiaceae bacterium]|nr:hypothetical protein [Armatimonadota bacterium]
MKIANFEINGVITPVIVHADGSRYDIPRLLALSGASIVPPRTPLDVAKGGATMANAISNAVASL